MERLGGEDGLRLANVTKAGLVGRMVRKEKSLRAI